MELGIERKHQWSIKSYSCSALGQALHFRWDGERLSKLILL